MWSYSGDPSSSSLDAVRFLLGDTVDSDQLLQDEELNFLLTQFDTDIYYAAAGAADTLSAKFTREIALSVDGINAGADALQNKYELLADNLRAMARRVRSTAGPYFGGVRRSDIVKDDMDADVVALPLRSGMNDNIRSGVADSGYVYDPETSIVEPQVNP